MKKTIIILVVLVLLAGLAAITLFNSKTTNTEPLRLNIHENTSYNALCDSLDASATFQLMAKTLGLDKRVRPGSYLVEPHMKTLALVRKLRNGQQDPIRLTIGKFRTPQQLNEYLNNNPKAEGEDVDPADGRIGEKLIVKNLSVATGSTLRVNGQNVEVGASLSVADGGVIDLDDGETLSVGKPFANFYGDGDQLASWSVAAKNVTDLACRGSAFRAVYDSQSNRTYFVCKSTGAGLVVLIR